MNVMASTSSGNIGGVQFLLERRAKSDFDADEETIKLWEQGLPEQIRRMFEQQIGAVI